MASNVDLSLDEIIKMNRGFRSNRGRGRGRGNARGRPNIGPFRSVTRGRSNSGGGIISNRGQRFNNRRGIRQRSRSGQTSPRRQASANRGSVNTRPRQNFLPNTRFGGGDGGTSKLLVSNLDYGVTDADIKELFAEFGPMRKGALHYDKSGKSLGTAEVVFERRFDAARAMRKYNGVPLDGRQMKIEITTSILPQLNLSPKSQRGNFPKRGRFQFRGRRNFNQM